MNDIIMCRYFDIGVICNITLMTNKVYINQQAPRTFWSPIRNPRQILGILVTSKVPFNIDGTFFLICTSMTINSMGNIRL